MTGRWMCTKSSEPLHTLDMNKIHHILHVVFFVVMWSLLFLYWELLLTTFWCSCHLYSGEHFENLNLRAIIFLYWSRLYHWWSLCKLLLTFWLARNYVFWMTSSMDACSSTSIGFCFQKWQNWYRFIRIWAGWNYQCLQQAFTKKLHRIFKIRT